MTSSTLRDYFNNVQLVDPRIVHTDHYMIKATIKSAPRKAQRKYLQGRRKFPLPPIKPTSPTFTQAHQLFMELKFYAQTQAEDALPLGRLGVRPHQATYQEEVQPCQDQHTQEGQ